MTSVAVFDCEPTAINTLRFEDEIILVTQGTGAWEAAAAR